ncbi:unnamed protein product [Allacma fusca]|uniref:Ig-like domain-containing protein n=1 Tax=Allacma fusca TaxID=39272 RepID=A0A8J2PVA8_9HEXA|nr:unnamed protein product [Allacma fusca]
MFSTFASSQQLLAVFLALLGASLAFEDKSRGNDSQISDEKLIWTDINLSVSILCQTPGSIEISQCFITQSSFKNPGEAILKINLTDTHIQSYPGFTTHWDDYKNGKCGVTIENVSLNDFGFWNCSLFAANQHFEESVRLNQWVRPPFIPIIEFNPNDLLDVTTPSTANNTRNLTCCSENGVPDLGLYFQIGSRRIQSPGNNIRNYTSNSNHVCIEWTNATFLARYNREKLICGADHVSLSKGERLTDSIDLNIQYDPRLRNLSNGTTVTIFVTKKTSIWNLTVTAEGNPVPEFDFFLLFQNGSISSFDRSSFTPNTFLLVSKPRINNPFEHESKLQIFNVQQLVDENIALRFHATNIHGRSFVTFRFEIDNSWFLIKLLIVLGLALVLIVTATISVVITVRSNSQALVAPAENSGRTKNRSKKEKARSSDAIPEETPCIPAETDRKEGDDSNRNSRLIETPV